MHIVNKTTYNDENFWQGVLIFKKGVLIAVRLIYIALSVFALVAAFYVMGKVGLSVDELSSAIRSSAAPLLILTFVFVYSSVKIFTFKKGLRKKFTDNRTRAFEPKTLTFNEDGYTCSGEYETREVTYSYIDRIVETKDRFYILNKQGMDLLDKSGFEEGSPEDFKNFISLKCPLVRKNF